MAVSGSGAGGDWAARLRWLPGFFEPGEHPAAAAEMPYRIAGGETFLRMMLERVRRQAIADGEHAGTRPLERFNLEAEGSWLKGLLEAWAAVGEVLSFYQERIANEGYLATAREDLSIRELVRLIDYRPFPGAGAGTHLAFGLLDIKDMPEQVLIPVGTSVMSLPTKAELPQSWETVEEILGRPCWNELKPRVPHVEVPASLPASATSARLRGLEEGLEAGAPILILGTAAGESRPSLRRLVEAVAVAGEDGAPDSTRVVWQGELSTPLSEPLEAVEVLALDQRFDLFGRAAPEWDELADEVKREFSSVRGGVAVAAAGEPWRSISPGLPEGPVTALVAGPDGSIYAGTDDGIYRCVDGETWSRSGSDLVGVRIETLATDGQSQVYAGTTKNGVLRTSDGETWETVLGESRGEPIFGLGLGRRDRPRSGRLPLAPVRALLPSRHGLYAGTDRGVFVFDPLRDRWRAINRGLPGTSRETGRSDLVVRALAPGRGERELYAGTDAGVYHSSRGGRRWRSFSRGLPGFDLETGECATAVNALLADFDPRARTAYLFAGTGEGVFRSIDGGDWQTASGGLPGTDPETGLSATEVRSMVLASDAATLETVLHAGTPAGVFGSSDHGDYFSPVADELASRPVTALALSPAGGLLAAVPKGGFELDGWPRFHLREGRVDLDTLTTEIGEGDWLALSQDDGGSEHRRSVFRARSVTSVQRSDFTLSALVTRVVPDRPIPGAELYDLRRARLLAGPRRLELLAGRLPVHEPLAAERVALDVAPGTVEPFDAPRQVIVSGRPMRAAFFGDIDFETDDGERLEAAAGAELQVLAHAAAGERLRLVLRRGDGAAGEALVPASSFAWRSAREEDGEVSQRVTAAWLDGAGAGEPALVLNPPLAACYDPRTVTIRANVAEASQGKTVPMDVLGAGDSTQAHQRFPLKVLPLTYLRNATAKGYSSTLEVRVNGVRWRQVPSLWNAGPGDQVYMVRPDRDGAPAVIFGDGVHGSRLPTGHENVVASYRSGMWPDALEAHKLRVLQVATLGLQEVTNPLPVAAGRGPESADETRWRAPLSLRTLDRIVSLQDHEDFCLTYAGIIKARGAALDTGGGRLLQVTIATADGAPVSAGDDFHRQLIAAIEAARGYPAAISIDSCRRIRFQLEAEVLYDPDHRASDVVAEVRRRLGRAYAYERARFGARVSASELLERIGAVRGVVSASLERLHRDGAEPALAAYVEAAPARWDRRRARVVPAELLELKTRGGVTLKMVAER